MRYQNIYKDVKREILMKKRTKIIIFIVALILSISWIVIVKTVDVGKVGPRGSEVGLSLINSSFHDLWHYDECGYNEFWYDLSWYIGLFSLAVVGIHGLLGLFQLITRKSLWKVDKCILAVSVLYIVTGGLYLLFEKVVINYRPIIMPGYQHLEASFPSTHTMLILTILGTALPLAGRYITNPKLAFAAKLFCIVIMWLTIICRLLSGVHWFTDIIGEVLISLYLISLHKALCFKKENK
jgi:undecaprenyl-diphosphatase